MTAARCSIAPRIVCYVDAVREISDAYYAKCFPDMPKPIVLADVGSRYVRVMKIREKSRSVHSFVDRTTGDILKPATFKGPAKHPRGNVMEPDFGVKTAGVTAYGVRYL